MSDLIKYEADMLSLRIIYNTLKLNKSERKKYLNKLIPKIGYLYESSFENLKAVTSLTDLKDNVLVHGHGHYNKMLDKVYDPAADAKDDHDKIANKDDNDEVASDEQTE